MLPSLYKASPFANVPRTPSTFSRQKPAKAISEPKALFPYLPRVAPTISKMASDISKDQNYLPYSFSSSCSKQEAQPKAAKNIPGLHQTADDRYASKAAGAKKARELGNSTCTEEAH